MMATPASVRFITNGVEQELTFCLSDYPGCCGATIIHQFGAKSGSGYTGVDALKLESPEAIAAGKAAWDTYGDKKSVPRWGGENGGWPAGCGVFLSAITTSLQEKVAKFLIATGWVEQGQGKNYANKLRMFGYTRTIKVGTHEPLPAPPEQQPIKPSQQPQVPQPEWNVAAPVPVVAPKKRAPRKLVRAPKEQPKPAFIDVYPDVEVYPVEAWKLPKRAVKK